MKRHSDKEEELAQELLEDLQQLSLREEEKGKEHVAFLEEHALPDLEISLEKAYIILEIDGSMTGWGGVCKWKPKKADPRSMEKVCAYAHGKFPTIKSIIDTEIFAAMETMSALKIHFLDKDEITLRTECQVIISFHNKSIRNKPSRVRWIAFTDFITAIGVKVNFEHIDGKLNDFADSLSRLVECSETVAVLTEEGLGDPLNFPYIQNMKI
ncbi:hypothetical protein ZIOFF_006381 [Zingiber officinale]|uniref:Uncharacterized protein n=1 Tax=Zingiber officinale TaxID=94328 RepID=A0A8J5HZ72_ZINOF|nr:hypothetical protein ZIOFF_006381 [Zingiber officinale]